MPLPGHVGTELTISRSEHELEKIRGERRAEEIRVGQDWQIWNIWAPGCEGMCRGWTYKENIVLDLFRKDIFWDCRKLRKKCKEHLFHFKLLNFIMPEENCSGKEKGDQSLQEPPHQFCQPDPEQSSQSKEMRCFPAGFLLTWMYFPRCFERRLL